jgi:hypothetical protein
VNGAQERDALRKWVSHQGMDTKLVDELPSLPIGTMWAWSPQWLQVLRKVRIAAKTTYDASATPKVGERRVQRELKPLNLDDLKSKMAATIERDKATNPRELQRQIADLKRQLASRPETPPKIIEKPVVTDKQIGDVSRIVERLEAEGQRRIEDGQRIQQTAREFASALRAVTQQPVRPTPTRPTLAVQNTARAERRAASGDAGDLPKGERAVLIAVAQYPDGAEREQLTVLTGYKRSSRDAYLQRLRERGYINTNGERIFATDDGIAALGNAYEPLPTGQALRDYWIARLPEGERRILEVLIGQWPAAVPRDDLDEPTGYKRSSRDAYLRR